MNIRLIVLFLLLLVGATSCVSPPAETTPTPTLTGNPLTKEEPPLKSLGYSIEDAELGFRRVDLTLTETEPDRTYTLPPMGEQRAFKVITRDAAVAFDSHDRVNAIYGRSLTTPTGYKLNRRSTSQDIEAPVKEVEEFLGEPARKDKTTQIMTYFYPSKGLQVTFRVSSTNTIGRDFIICPPWKE